MPPGGWCRCLKMLNHWVFQSQILWVTIRFPPLHQRGSSVVILRVDPMWSGCFQTRCCCFISGFKQRVEQAKAPQISLQRQKNGHSWTRRPRAGLKHSLYQHGRNSINIIDQRSGLDSLSHEYTEENGCCFDLLASTPPPPGVLHR